MIRFVLMIPMTFLARYFKGLVPTWFFIHWRLQAVGILLALVGVGLALWGKQKPYMVYNLLLIFN
jgi:hypothetical protein